MPLPDDPPPQRGPIYVDDLPEASEIETGADLPEAPATLDLGSATPAECAMEAVEDPAPSSLLVAESEDGAEQIEAKSEDSGDWRKRRRKPAHKRLDHTIAIRMTKAEFDKIHALAAAASQPMSKWIMRKALGRR